MTALRRQLSFIHLAESPFPGRRTFLIKLLRYLGAHRPLNPGMDVTIVTNGTILNDG
jgi:hypothetical protein